MIQPKNKLFKVKFHLVKIQASNNKVNSRVHAYLMIDNQQLQFQGTPQLKKNIAIFGSDLQYENFMIAYDEVTSLYEDKKALVVIEFETMGAYIKVGEASVNLGEVLNEKKYRVVNVYPLSKCYDKSAKIKLAVDFVPEIVKGGGGVKFNSSVQGNNTPKNITGATSNLINQKQSRAQNLTQQLTPSSTSTQQPNTGYYKNPTSIIKSRLAQQQNAILQSRIYEYEKRMDTYRNNNHQLSQKMQQQIQRKDQKISQLTLEVSRMQNSVHLITLQSESFKANIKTLTQQLQSSRQQTKQSKHSIQQLTKQIVTLSKQLQAKQLSLQNTIRTRDNKQKHLTAQISKYTSKYSTSQQQKNKIIFQLQNKLKAELEKKDHHYQELINSNESKQLQTIKALKQRNKQLQHHQKLIQQANQLQQNKLKSLTLQLQKAHQLTSQKQQEMIYMNQQMTKLKSQYEQQSNQLDSITFSYQSLIAELANSKQLTKQLSYKLQGIRTQLSLSNQTVTQLNQNITQMNKQLQVHSQREYYMKEHYEQELYDMQLNINNGNKQNVQLQSQLTKLKEQLKISLQKLQEEESQKQLIKITLSNYQKQLPIKNSHIIKLNEEKLHLQAQSKNLYQQIQQLQQQIVSLQQEKIYISQTLTQKRLTIENEKSLQWTYKIESLQNDIKILLDKFKNQKEVMKEQYKKEQNKKVEEINKLLILNKKMKDEVNDVKDKLAKRQTHCVSIEKGLKIEKEKSIELERQVSGIKQALRVVSLQKQSYEQTVRDLSRQRDSYTKTINQLQSRSQTNRKQLTSTKTSLHRLISMILQYMVKRYTQRVSFQDISIDGVESQLLGYVNIAVRKYCEEHNRTREMVRELEEWKRKLQEGEGYGMKGMSYGDDEVEGFEGLERNEESNYFSNGQQKKFNSGLKFNRLLIQQRQLQQQQVNNKNVFRNKLSHRSSNSPSNNTASFTFFNPNPQPTSTQREQEIDKLKKLQSQYKVKIKSLQQEIQKHERNAETIRFQASRVKSELEQAQDEITHMGFQLKKKQKIIKQLQSQLQQAQKQLTSNPQYSQQQKSKQKLSQLGTQLLQQPPITISSASLSIIRDIQSKLSIKQEQLVHKNKQLQSLREQYLTELGNVKKLQARLKEKSSRVENLEKDLQQSSSKTSDMKDKQLVKLKKQVTQQQQQKIQLQEKILHLQQLVKQYQSQLTLSQQRNRQLHQQLKSSEVQFRRNIQSTSNQMNDRSTEYETEIMQLKSQLSQLQNKLNEVTQKNLQFSQMIAKKSAELETLKERLVESENQLIKKEQTNDQFRNKTALKFNTLYDRVRQLQSVLEGKQFQLQEIKFAYQGRVLDLQRQLDDLVNTPIKAGGNLSARS